MDTLFTVQGESALPFVADSLLDRPTTSWKGYTSVDTLRPGACYIMPFPEDSTAETTLGPDLQAVMEHTYFSQRDTLLPTGLPYRSYGVVGTPVPYTVRSDNTLTILLLLCFVLFIVSLAHSGHFLARQLKDFFHPSHDGDDIAESGGELRFLTFLSLVNVLVLSISTYLLATDIAATSAIAMRAGMTLIAAFMAALVAYFCLKWLAGTVVNTVFFGLKKNLQWMTLQLQMSALEGVMLFPMLALQIYFDFATQNAIIYICLVLFLDKILTFYKSFQIFFKGNGLYLQTFLYFCALEIAPLLAFGGAGLAIIDFMKINF